MTETACAALAAVAFRELAVSGAAIVGAIVAIAGLATWRNELRGKAEYALARRLLRGVYDVLEAIKGVRVPAIFSGELKQSADKRSQAAEATTQQTAHVQYVYEDRWALVQGAVARLRSETLEAQVLWGRDFGHVVEPLHRLVGDLNVAIAVILANQRGEPVPVKRLVDSDLLVYSVSSDPQKDAFLNDLLNAVRAIEDELRPHLLSRHRRRRARSGAAKPN